MGRKANDDFPAIAGFYRVTEPFVLADPEEVEMLGSWLARLAGDVLRLVYVAGDRGAPAVCIYREGEEAFAEEDS